MKTYAEKIIDKEDMELFCQIRQVINLLELPDIGYDKNGQKREVSCHMLAEATSRIFDVKLRHGYFMTRYEHSWVYTKNFNIIDLYPVGMVGGPLLVDRRIIFSHGPIYIVKEDLDYIGSSERDKQEYKHAVNLVEACMMKVIESLKQNTVCV